MDAIQKDIEDITAKTSSLYTRGIQQMKHYARTISPEDFKAI